MRSSPSYAHCPSLLFIASFSHSWKRPGAGNKLFHSPNYKLLSGPLVSWCFHISFDLRCFSEPCRLRRGRGDMGTLGTWLCAWGRGVEGTRGGSRAGFPRGIQCQLPQADQAPAGLCLKISDVCVRSSVHAKNFLSF